MHSSHCASRAPQRGASLSYLEVVTASICTIHSAVLLSYPMDYARWESLDKDTSEASGREAPSFSRGGQNVLLLVWSLGSVKVRAAVRGQAARLARHLRPATPPSLSISEMERPVHHFIYYCNDYIAHCLPIVSVIDLINFQLIIEGDI